jgi:hypothetical protein
MSVLAQEEIRTKGFRAVFGVILMFVILCGGVWMLLQSSFGPKQAYLISSVAFWGSWLVLALIWWMGVPGLTLGPIKIPRSTPQWYGPQGIAEHWVVAGPVGEEKAREKYEKFVADESNQRAFTFIDDSVRDDDTKSKAASAAATAQEVAPEAYAVALGVGAADITIPGVARLTRIELAKEDGDVRYARVTFDAAEPAATDSAGTKALIERIEPMTFTLWFDPGNLAEPTYWSLLLFFVLTAGHTVALVRYELNRVPQPQGAPERVPAAV